MLENTLLAIVLPLLNAGEYFIGHCLSISECRRIFVAIVLPLLKQENILLAIVLSLMIAGEYLLPMSCH